MLEVGLNPHTLRLIFDARVSNAMFSDPDCVPLAAAQALASVEVPPGERLFVAQGDVACCFCGFLLPPHLRDAFGLPPVPWAAPPPAARRALGWSWAVYFVQQAMRHIVGARVPADRLLAQCVPRAPAQPGSGVSLTHIDNFAALATSQEEAGCRSEEMLAAVAAAGVDAGLEPHGSPLLGFENWTARARGGAPWLVGFGARPWPCAAHLRALGWGKTRRAGRPIARVVGRASAIVLLRPEMLSVFSSVYVFADRFFAPSARVWASARKELRAAWALLPLALADVSLPWSPAVESVDASLHGFGVAEKDWDAAAVGVVGRASERGRCRGALRTNRRSRDLVEVAARRWRRRDKILALEAEAAVWQGVSAPVSLGVMSVSQHLLQYLSINSSLSMNYSMQLFIICNLHFIIMRNCSSLSYNNIGSPNRIYSSRRDCTAPQPRTDCGSSLPRDGPWRASSQLPSPQASLAPRIQGRRPAAPRQGARVPAPRRASQRPSREPPLPLAGKTLTRQPPPVAATLAEAPTGPLRPLLGRPLVPCRGETGAGRRARRSLARQRPGSALNEAEVSGRAAQQPGFTISYLAAAAVMSATQRNYLQALRRPLAWLRVPRAPPLAAVDWGLMLEQHVYLRDRGLPEGDAACTLAAVRWGLPRLPRPLRRGLPLATAAAIGWRRLEKPLSRPPAPRLVVVLLALWLCARGREDIALFLLLAFETCTRPSEGLALAGMQLAPPVPGETGACQCWALLVRASELDVLGKTGEFDNSVALGLPRHRLLEPALRRLKRARAG
ncbi:unnamed protein product, partial [Prorocentrum cordatum]